MDEFTEVMFGLCVFCLMLGVATVLIKLCGNKSETLPRLYDQLRFAYGIIFFIGLSLGAFLQCFGSMHHESAVHPGATDSGSKTLPRGK